jgi:3-oxoacyl-[acyl-carrier-protein] synthase III
MNTSVADLTAHLLQRIDRVRRQLGEEPEGVSDPTARFADLLDSMGMVEFLALLARDCGVAPADVEEAAGHQFDTVAEVARRLSAAGLVPGAAAEAGATPVVAPLPPAETAPCWLAAAVARLPETVEPAAALDLALGRPAGWLERHAGIRSRRVWAGQDPLAAAADAGQECLGRAGVLAEEVGALLVTSEAPPRLAGLAAALHSRLGLRPETAAVEVGGACTGFLSAVWLAQGLLGRRGPVVVLAVEAPSQFLTVGPGPAGEAAALFGDGAAAALLCADNAGGDGVCFNDVSLGADGSGANLLRVERAAGGPVEVRMEGTALAGRAVRAMADLLEDVTRRHGLAPADLRAAVVHGGNGRMPALVARQLGLPAERVRSATPDLGNLGSASLPVAWALTEPTPPGPVAWAAVRAGLTWAAALTVPAKGRAPE